MVKECDGADVSQIFVIYDTRGYFNNLYIDRIRRPYSNLLRFGYG